MGSETTEEIRLPVINFSDEKVKAEGGVEWRRTSKKVREAMEEYGCFIAKYEGVSKELREEVLKAVKELFELPIERKKMNKYEKPFNGYVGELRTLPLHESLGIDDATNFNQVQSFSHLMWPPEGNHHFRSFSLLLLHLSFFQFFVFQIVSKFYIRCSNNLRLMLVMLKKSLRRNLMLFIRFDELISNLIVNWYMN